MFILFTSKFRHSSSIAKTTIFMNNKVDSTKTFEELLKYLSSLNSNVAKRIWHKYFGWGILVWVLVLKNIPVGYDMRKYQPYTSTSLMWDVRSYQVYTCYKPGKIQWIPVLGVKWCEIRYILQGYHECPLAHYLLAHYLCFPRPNSWGFYAKNCKAHSLFKWVFTISGVAPAHPNPRSWDTHQTHKCQSNS
jgi:hypothetical protein